MEHPHAVDPPPKLPRRPGTAAAAVPSRPSPAEGCARERGGVQHPPHERYYRPDPPMPTPYGSAGRRHRLGPPPNRFSRPPVATTTPYGLPAYG
jgi:hypothetical protein